MPQLESQGPRRRHRLRGPGQDRLGEKVVPSSMPRGKAQDGGQRAEQPGMAGGRPSAKAFSSCTSPAQQPLAPGVKLGGGGALRAGGMKPGGSGWAPSGGR